jgi:phosphatidate cytidylyltransferase
VVAVGDTVITARARGSALAGFARRVVSAAIFIPAFLWLLYRGPAPLFTAFVLLLAGRAQWEFTRMFQRDGAGVFPRVGLLAGLAVTASFGVAGVAPVVLTAVVVMLLAAPLAVAGAPDVRPTALTLLGVCYVNWLLGYALWLREFPQGAEWIVFLLAVTWTGETAAYLVGSRLGRVKLAPVISPAKTIEGALAQLAISVAVGALVSWWLFAGQPWWRGLVGGLLLGVVGQVGDLAESVLKRSAHTKDTGGLIPGHGGLLDRLDSLLFNTPALFYYARYVG